MKNISYSLQQYIKNYIDLKCLSLFSFASCLLPIAYYLLIFFYTIVKENALLSELIYYCTKDKSHERQIARNIAI